jgi:hypothetical protein
VEAAGVELFSVLTARRLLILRMARGTRKPTLPIPLYVACTKTFLAPIPQNPAGPQYHTFGRSRNKNEASPKGRITESYGPCHTTRIHARGARLGTYPARVFSQSSDISFSRNFETASPCAD